MYFDEFEVCNPLGTSCTKHKLCAIYWIFGTIACLLAQVPSINLALLHKNEDVRRYGYPIVLDPLCSRFKKLLSTMAYFSLLCRFLKGTVQVVVANNLGAHGMALSVKSLSGKYIYLFILKCSHQKGQTSKQRSDIQKIRHPKVKNPKQK